MGFETKPDIRPLHNRVLVGDCLAELKKIPTGSIDLVFADPPYSRGVSSLSGSIGELVAAGGRLVLQTDADREAPEIAGFSAPQRRAYSRNVFWIYERTGA